MQMFTGCKYRHHNSDVDHVTYFKRSRSTVRDANDEDDEENDVIEARRSTGDGRMVRLDGINDYCFFRDEFY